MESDDCRLARLIIESVLRDLQNRKGMWPDLDEEMNDTIRHALYTRTLNIIRAEAALTGSKAEP